jgi:hypothetical protein
MSDPKERPWEMAEAFVYRPEWTSRAFSVLRFVIRVTCVDTHKELKQAWGEIISRGMPERATDILGQMTAVNYDLAMGDLAAVLSARDKVREVREARRLIEACRRQYKQAANIAKAGGKR